MTSVTVSIIAGGAGFVGTNLASALCETGRRVVIIDNLSNGKSSYLADRPELADVQFIEADLADRAECESAFATAAAEATIGEVWHMAANSDIPAGVADADVDHRDTFLTTFEILRALRRWNIPALHFASSSAIYGDLGETSLHEEIGPLFPISNYGAMKLASEAQLSAAVESFLQRASIFRFPNVVGIPATHGVILDFVRKLKRDRSRLDVLGDGTQQKAYLHVSDLVDAMMVVANQDSTKMLAVNIGPIDEGVTVRWIAEQVVGCVAPGAAIHFGTGNKGWVGDIPRFNYSTRKLQSYGWQPRMGSKEAVTCAIQEIARQEGF